MSRRQVERIFVLEGGRRITITAHEDVGPEDCLSLLVKAVLHRYKTGEDVVPTISRDVKDAIIKTNLVI